MVLHTCRAPRDPSLQLIITPPLQLGAGRLRGLQAPESRLCMGEGILFQVSSRFTNTQEFQLFRISGFSARRLRNLVCGGGGGLIGGGGLFLILVILKDTFGNPLRQNDRLAAV